MEAIGTGGMRSVLVPVFPAGIYTGAVEGPLLEGGKKYALIGKAVSSVKRFAIGDAGVGHLDLGGITSTTSDFTQLTSRSRKSPPRSKVSWAGALENNVVVRSCPALKFGQVTSTARFVYADTRVVVPACARTCLGACCQAVPVFFFLCGYCEILTVARVCARRQTSV